MITQGYFAVSPLKKSKVVRYFRFGSVRTVYKKEEGVRNSLLDSKLSSELTFKNKKTPVQPRY